MIRYFLLIVITISFASCSEQDCNTLPKSFQTYSEAKHQIEKTKFLFSEKINTSKSSWIRNAEYYSCDSKTEFLIFKTDKKEYIHQDLPIEIWNSFKASESFGQFYNRHINNQYQLILHQ